MGVFDDKKFEQLDWMTQITETIESELNGLLARLPDVVELDYNAIISFVDFSYSMRLDSDRVVRKMLQEYGKKMLSWEDENTIKGCYAFEVSDDLVINMESRTMIGSIKLVKTTQTLSCEQLQVAMGRKGIERLNRVNWSDSDAIARANEVMELLGNCEHALKNRSYKKKRSAIINRLERIFTTNEWRIRDMELADKIGLWISQYISNGNLAAFSNFCKVKVMTHQGGPIYSIEELQ